MRSRRATMIVAVLALATAGTVAGMGPALAAEKPAESPVLCGNQTTISRASLPSLQAGPSACFLRDVSVRGQSDLEPGAVLSATHTTLADAVVIHSAALDLTHATAASVTGQGWTGLDVFDSWVQTNVQLTAASNDHPNPSVTMVVTNSSIGNDLVAASPGAAGVTGSVIGGQFDLLGFGSLDVESTRVMQSMFLTQLGRTTLCGVQVAHNLQIAGEQAGATLSVGPQTSGCAGQVTVGGNVTVVGNTGAVILGHLTIKGNLACSGNATAPVLANVTVRGTRSGQCA